MMRAVLGAVALTIGVTSTPAGASGIGNLVVLENACRPWAVVEYHIARDRFAGREVADRVWVAPSYAVAMTTFDSQRTNALRTAGRRGHRFRVEPALGVRIYTAVVLHESGGHPWSIGDNARPHGSYTFATKAEAIAKARDLFRRGHTNLDIGLGQVNTGNFSGYGLDLESAFDPCTSIRTGGLILAKSYYGAAEVVGYGPRALEMALRAYNTGHWYIGQEYADTVWSIASRLPPTVGDVAYASRGSARGAR